MFNETQVTFTGWIGSDVTLRDVAGGQQVASFRVATRPRRFREGEWVDGATTWHTVKAWNRLARHVAESLSSGEPVLVHGKLVADTWTREDGTAMTSYAVVASSVGHDLVHGTSAFRRPAPAAEQPQTAVEQARSAVEQAEAA
jgi:single-strand DNA-binding protein